MENERLKDSNPEELQKLCEFGKCIWKVRKLLLRRAINYKHGYDIIPAGTEVREAKIGSDRDGRQAITFITVKDNREYFIYFVGDWHPGKTIEDYLGYMFTTKNFEELTAGMTETEIEEVERAFPTAAGSGIVKEINQPIGR